MSFKRAGDDHCALRRQKKQRAADLLGEDIPADEASQTRSGKFVCLVCPHNPVLDMATLVIHRQGKKHSSNVAIKIEKEHDLSELLQKREQEKYLKEAASTSCFQNDSQATKSKETGPLLERTRQLTEAIKKQWDIGGKAQSFQVKTLPSLDISKKNKPFFQSRVKIHFTRNPGKEKVENTQDLSSSSCPGVSKERVAKETDVAKEINVTKGTCCHTKEASLNKSAHDTKQKTRKELSKEQQRYLELKMAGWVMDHRSGKWVKDDNVEFDSDEDDPSPLD